jgi:CHAD domain-containing protein
MNGRTIQKEIEVKLELPPTSLRALKRVPLFKTSPRQTSEVSVYFDTTNHKLRKNGLMLRVRRVCNRYVQTINATNNSGPLERLKDGLGDLNDIAVDEERIREMSLRYRSNPNRVFAAGLLTREEAQIGAAMAVATKAYAEVAKVKPFWQLMPTEESYPGRTR